MDARGNGGVDYKEAMREQWSGAAGMWSKWNEKFAVQTREATELVVRAAELSPGMRVLDLASGTGEPALRLARTVGPDGRVVATDLVPEMLAAARQKALSLGVSNLEFCEADAEHLPFAHAAFDRVTCRFGLMFFPDVAKALTEIHRVLKPGGQVAFLVWGTYEQNPWFCAMLDPFLKHVKLPPAPPDAPGPFRFADEAKFAATLAAARFREIRTHTHRVSWPWPGSAEEAWEAKRELSAPFKKVIASLPAEKTEEVLGEVIEEVRRFQKGDQVDFFATLVIATGVA